MTEIRPVNCDETEGFLLLLCEAFDLDFERAKCVFFREPLYDVDRKWAYFRNGRIESILTTVPLQFGWGRAIGIAGVATRLCSRGSGLAGDLLREVLRVSDQCGEGPALLFAKRTELYESLGFRTLDQAIRARIEPSPSGELDSVLTFEEVSAIYNHWASEDPYRLRRDERRWDYWKWNLRVCSPFSTGYLCVEGTLVRECIASHAMDAWPVLDGAEWVGLRSMARALRAPISDPGFELHLMGFNFDQVPQMFMTDQF